ncbi:hypothetical protein ACIA8K_29200 [Catenuloplanes sp. NPDC051500]|uniref:hypothetical protein n=1 Tax=Catenuloplanes sp. NPDC051500 TaxID=3363959 RepID=UPI0037BA8876
MDGKISRLAVTVTARPDGWEVDVTNRHSADMQLWGQAPMAHQPQVALRWPRITVTVRGDQALRHLVLLDNPAFSIAAPRPQLTSRLTETLAPPQPLTAAQQQALRLLYAELLAWPPLRQAVPLRIKQVARQLGIGPEAVRRRLEEARQKAYALGLGRDLPLSDPEYLHVLVRAGYLMPTDDEIDPILRG